MALPGKKSLANPSNRIERRVEPTYADLPKTMRLNPITGDVAPLYNEDAINEALRNIVLSNKGDFLMRPNLGGDIRALLFSNLTPMMIEVIRSQIQNSIKTMEPRVRVLEVLVSSSGGNDLSVSISYEIPARENPIQTTIFIERKR